MLNYILLRPDGLNLERKIYMKQLSTFKTGKEGLAKQVNSLATL
jgi:hypothetical protein